MPYNYQLTWMPHAKRWRKRYRGQTYYLKTSTHGKRDRQGYESALREWERLKAYVDGLGPSPYTHTGAIIPEPVNGNGHAPQPVPQQLAFTPVESPFVVGHSFGAFDHPEQVIRKNSVYAGERKIDELAEAWLSHRRKQTQRGELSLKQWGTDNAKLQVFRDFLSANFPQVTFIEQIDPMILNLYREKQWEFIEAENDHRISKATLKQRLDTVTKWLTWLVDQNLLAELPKDLRTYGRVKLDKPKPLFWSVDEVKLLAECATERTKLYIMLALNLGFTQRDIATLTPDMIDWDSGVVTRDRHKTGVPMKGKLWPSTLALLSKHRNPRKSGPVLLDQNETPLYVERVNDNGKVIVNDAIRLAFNRVKGQKKTGLKRDPRSFKHLRKSGANEIEKSRPDLTSLFLGHSEQATKRYYVTQHFEELFTEVAKLEAVFGFGLQS